MYITLSITKTLVCYKRILLKMQTFQCQSQWTISFHFHRDVPFPVLYVSVLRNSVAVQLLSAEVHSI